MTPNELTQSPDTPSTSEATTSAAIPHCSDRLGRGERFPIKWSQLKSAIRSAHVASELSFVYFMRAGGAPRWRGRVELPVLKALYHREHSGGLEEGLTRLWVHAVPSDERQAISAALADHGLSDLVDWLADTRALGDNQRAMNHSLHMDFVRGDEKRLDVTVDALGRFTYL